MKQFHALVPVLFLSLAGCGPRATQSSVIQIAQLGPETSAEFDTLRGAFAGANPGYDIAWHPACVELEASVENRVLFVQGPLEREVEPTVGDILLLPAGETWQAPDETRIDLLAFQIPSDIPAGLPANIRPDWDPLITDTLGGCAEETGAYRRILLTWLKEKGPYVLHALNAHRVRITDSFSHYHPIEGGFDELYLVQMASIDSRVLTSESVDLIEGEDLTAEQANGLIQSRTLRVGDLVYLPRGTMHRGIGGALVQVISVPGFVPNSEIGLDHHLRAINEKLKLTGGSALPFHAAASSAAVLK
ncbi:MAG: hypothetical protein ACI8QS_000899 [Planctomycetota bacterium]|jgi:hypothetical protein